MKTSKMLIFMSLLVVPMSTNYQLQGFSVGGGGGNNVGSSNYDMEAKVGEMANNKSIGASYDLSAGLIFAEQANLPSLTTLDNKGSLYNQLYFVINPANNPTAYTKFALAISSDNFVTTSYVKSDGTVGTSLALTDYQTYSLWGGSSGSYITGLKPSTNYQVKVKATTGKFTETGWGPAASQSTLDPTLTFDIDIGASDVKTNPPYSVDFSDLLPSTVTTAVNKIWVDLATNATSGGSVYVYGQNAGLYSTMTQYKINSVSGNLDSLASGFGAQVSTTNQGVGASLLADPTYGVLNNNVGVMDGNIRQIFYSTAAVTAGRGSFWLKAKTASDTPAASDYSETLTVVASANF